MTTPSGGSLHAIPPLSGDEAGGKTNNHASRHRQEEQDGIAHVSTLRLVELIENETLPQGLRVWALRVLISRYPEVELPYL